MSGEAIWDWKINLWLDAAVLICDFYADLRRLPYPACIRIT